MSRIKMWMVLVIVASCCCVAAAQTKEKWRLGTQAYSFNRFTFCEAAEKTKSLNLRYIEAYPQQKVGGDVGDVVFSDMNPAQRQQVKQVLRRQGLTLVNYGVVGLTNDEQQCRKVFDFAKDMGIETIVSEPPEDAFEMIDKLCNEYQIGVAIHNHPNPSHYWDPNTVMKVCQGRSKWIGACADTGHWTRSNIDPLKAVRMLGQAGRIRSVHFKDLNEFGLREAHDVPWGTGVSKAREVLAELAKQGFEGVFSIEYEYNWDNSVPEIRKCVEWFKKTAAELSDVPVKNVFQKDLSNAVMPPKGWAFDADGVLTPSPDGHGDIWTKERYGNFILELDFKIPERGNSGVFIRTGSIENWINTAIEVQIHATTDGTKYGQCGAIYDCLPPSKDANKGPGEWNHYVITCLDNKIYVNLNGQDIIDMDLDQWTQAGKNPDGTTNKFTTAYKDMPREGHLGFQYHGNPIWLRNLKIKSFDPVQPAKEILAGLCRIDVEKKTIRILPWDTEEQEWKPESARVLGWEDTTQLISEKSQITMSDLVSGKMLDNNRIMLPALRGERPLKSFKDLHHQRALLEVMEVEGRQVIRKMELKLWFVGESLDAVIGIGTPTRIVGIPAVPCCEEK